MADTSNILTISGANGTGTSLVLAMLNARRDIFIMYEVRPYRQKRGDYTLSFLERFPELEPIFSNRSLSLLARYARIENALRDRGHRYRYFGDKVPTLEAREVARLAMSPFFIFTVRDIRTWLCKDKIFRLSHVAGDAVPIVRRYLQTFFEALSTNHALVLRTEDCILDNERIVDQLIEYLQLPDRREIGRWWKHVIPAAQDPKLACPWFGKAQVPGKAAGLRPIGPDVEGELRNHKLWDVLLPVFDKYYLGLDERRFSVTEIASDRKRLDRELTGLRAPLADLFRSFTTWKFAHGEGGRPIRRQVWRLTEDRRLYRPGRFPLVGVDEAREVTRNTKRPVLLMVEEEDEPGMATLHWNVFDSRPFRNAVEQAGVLVLRLSHTSARALLPPFADLLLSPCPSYFCRRKSRTDWRLLPPEQITLDGLLKALAVLPRRK